MLAESHNEQKYFSGLHSRREIHLHTSDFDDHDFDDHAFDDNDLDDNDFDDDRENHDDDGSERMIMTETARTTKKAI